MCIRDRCRSRRWCWRPHANVLNTVDPNVIRVRSGRPTVLHKVPERQSSRSRQTWPCHVHGELCPTIRVTCKCVARINVEQQGRKVSNVRSRGSDIRTDSIRAHAYLKTICVDGSVYGPSPEL